MSEDWKRPESLAYPSIWSRFNGKREINGAIPKFWIQDIPEDMFGTAADFISSNYIFEEPLCRFSNLSEDKISMEEGRQVYEHIASKKLGLICFMENPDKSEKPIIAGINMLDVKSKNDKDESEKLSGEKFKMIIDTCKTLYAQIDAFELIGAEEYLGAFGLSVLPEFRGQGIGEQLLLARTPLCKALNLKASFTIFSSPAAQKLAELVGFKEVVSIPFDDLQKYDARFIYPGASKHAKSLKLMYKVF